VCGIVGYIGRRDAAPLIIEGLKKLEYRGYDSFGVATLGMVSISPNTRAAYQKKPVLQQSSRERLVSPYPVGNPRDSE